MEQYDSHGNKLPDELYIGNVRLDPNWFIVAHDRSGGIVRHQKPGGGYLFRVTLPARGNQPAATYEAADVAGLVAAVRAGEPA